jgi:Peptidase MA superfamily
VTRIALAVLLVASGVAATGVQAASVMAPSAPSAPPQTSLDVTFGEPTASGSLTEAVEFATTFKAATEPDRVELLARVDGATSDEVLQAVVEQVSDGSWTARVTDSGFTAPNTVRDFRFRAVDGDRSVVGPVARFTLADDRFDWRSMEEGPMTLHWYTGGEAFARRALEVGTRAIDRAASLLGVADVEPMDFFVYDSSEALYGALGPGTRENVGGQANPLIRTMVGVIRPDDVDSDWVDVLVAHELTHMVFADATDNPYRQPPRWLNEGLAVYLAEGYGVGDRAQVADAAGSGALTPLSAIAGLFPTSYDSFSLAYAQSVSAVDFFIDTYGQDALVRLIGTYRDGVTDDEAFKAATGADFRTFDDAWLAAQGVARPQPYGPQPAPRGPQPSAWPAADATPAITSAP